MSCDAYERMISRHIDGELEPDSREKLKRHLDGCVTCSELYKRMATLEQHVRVVTHCAVDHELSARVKDRLATAAADHPREWLVPVWKQVAVFATLTVVALGIGNLVGRSLSEVILDDRVADSGIELLVPQNQSFSDAMLTLAREENPR